MPIKTDTAKAVFDVEDFHDFVVIQSETAVRHVAQHYPYDSADAAVPSLLGRTGEVLEELRTELQERLAPARRPFVA